MQNTTVVGIVIAVVIILWGLRLLLRKSDDARPSLETPLQLNEESQLPIIPRHVRDQLQLPDRGEAAQETTAEHSEVSPAVEQVTDNIVADQTSAIAGTEQSSRLTAESRQEETKSDEEVTDEKAQNSDVAKTATVTPIEEFSLNPVIETAEIKDFDDESSILDKHLHEQQRCDDESSLANAESLIALNVYPNPRKALSGDKTLKVLLKYGLRYGELSCFHRYEDAEESSALLFSVLRITEEGPVGFDLEALSVEQVQGLAFFLALPHKDVQKGFDTMVSIAGLIAREIDGAVYDENNLELTPQLKEHWRHKAIDYRAE